MKILLVGINAKYIHSNPAIYSLKAYGEKYTNQEIEIAEYTINQQKELILRDIFSKRPDMVCFSCYLWNITLVTHLVEELHEIMPRVVLWLGGPEVSYESEKWLKALPMIKGIMLGEGEKTFSMLVSSYEEGSTYSLEEIAGLHFWQDGELIVTGVREPMDMDELVFPYRDLKDFENRIIYYETSRGCPFSCAYCLSAAEHHLRFRSMDLVKQELSFFIDAKVKQVKLIDRTFNASHRHFWEILQFLKEKDNGVTNFHFEIAGDLLNAKEIALLQSLRPGLVQLEIGVQSTREETLQLIHRKTDMALLKENVEQLKKNGNMHLHLDLIAGLPKESFVSFQNSFNEVYRMGGNELQLGFLKMLRGAPMQDMAEDYGIVCSKTPPYEVLFTDDITYEELVLLKEVEEMLEIYHNSGQFRYGEEELLAYEESPFSFYQNLASFYKEKGYPVLMSARQKRYEILLEYRKEKQWKQPGLQNAEISLEDACEKLRIALVKDYYLRENAKARPSFAPEISQSKDLIATFYEKEENRHRYFEAYDGYEVKQIARMTHAEVLGDTLYFFDYKKKNPVTSNAVMAEIKITQI